MVLLFAALLPLATVLIDDSLAKEDPCYEMRLEMARSRLALYEDPSDERRAALRQRVRKMLDTYSVSQLVESKERYACFTWLFRTALEIGDEEDLRPVTTRLQADPRMRSTGNELEQIARSSFDERRVARDSDEASIVLKDCGRNPRDAACRDQIKRLVRSGSTEMKPLLANPAWLSRPHDPDRAAWLTWLDLHEKFPDRRQRIRFALSTPPVFRGDFGVEAFPTGEKLAQADAQSKVSAWSLEDLLTGDDPRKWDPEDVALAVEVARDRYAERPMNSAEIGRRVRGIVRRLRGMGIVRVTALISPAIQLPEPHEEMHWLGHFPDERALYRREWELITERNATAPSKKNDPLPDQYRFIEQRWQETDANAPTPDMRALNAILKKREQRPEAQ